VTKTNETGTKTAAAKKSGVSKGVTLKRTVTIKALVTPKFKEYMEFELNEGVRQSQTKLDQSEQRVKELGDSVRQGGTPETTAQYARLEAEKVQIKQGIQEIKERINHIKGLELDSYFVQGMVDGFVNVNVGDNLYERLGAMEIVVKDGLVKSITAVGTFNPQPV